MLISNYIKKNYNNQNSWYWHKNGCTGQWNRRESPEITYSYEAYQSKTKKARIQNGEKTASSVNSVGKTGQLHAKESAWSTCSYYI